MSEDSIDTAENVEQIRDIIFGSQIKSFEQKLTQLDNSLKLVENKLTKMMYDSHVKLQKDTERSFGVLEEMIETLSQTVQKERLHTKELINTRDINLQAQVTSHNELLTRKFNIIKDNVSEEKRRSDEKLRMMKDEIQRTVEAELSSLSQNKLSRASMSEMFLDVAMRLQDAKVSDILDKGIKTGK